MPEGEAEKKVTTWPKGRTREKLERELQDATPCSTQGLALLNCVSAQFYTDGKCDEVLKTFRQCAVDNRVKAFSIAGGPEDTGSFSERIPKVA